MFSLLSNSNRFPWTWRKKCLWKKEKERQDSLWQMFQRRLFEDIIVKWKGSWWEGYSLPKTCVFLRCLSSLLSSCPVLWGRVHDYLPLCASISTINLTLQIWFSPEHLEWLCRCRLVERKTVCVSTGKQEARCLCFVFSWPVTRMSCQNILTFPSCNDREPGFCLGCQSVLHIVKVVCKWQTSLTRTPLAADTDS